MAMSPRGLLMRSKKLIKFDQVRERIHKLADQNFPDKVVDLKDVRVVADKNETKPSVNLEVPGIGTMNMTEWSKRQLASKLGINWDKWFDPKHIKPREIEEEMKRRFSRTGDSAKIRARRFGPKNPNRKHADGFIRAVLSPTYSAIDDVRIFDRLSKNFSGQMQDVDFIQNHLGSDFFNDRASHFSIVSEPVNMGPIDRKHDDDRVRRFYDLADAEGKLPEADWVYQGFHFRNSEVGYTAVTIDCNTFRLVCLNGAIVSVKDGRLLYRVHRGIDDDSIDGLLDSAFRKMPTAWELNKRRMSALQESTVGDIEAEIKRFLEKEKASKAYQDEVLGAFEREPLPNRYGVWQALTNAAKLSEDMEKRHEYEEMAGRYLAAA